MATKVKSKSAKRAIGGKKSKRMELMTRRWWDDPLEKGGKSRSVVRREAIQRATMDDVRDHHDAEKARRLMLDAGVRVGQKSEEVLSRPGLHKRSARRVWVFTLAGGHEVEVVVHEGWLYIKATKGVLTVRPLNEREVYLRPVGVHGGWMPDTHPARSRRFAEGAELAIEYTGPREPLPR